MYDILKHKLGGYITYPPEYPNIFMYRIIDTRASTQTMKEEILKEFVKKNF
jgi:hypothetical protein